MDNDGVLNSADTSLLVNCAISGGSSAGCVTSSYNRAIYYAHNDHLGTPHMLTDESGAAVWSAVYEPFGKATVTANQGVELNVRLPGQYYDAETGLHYNYYRTYYPESGRYVTSDPTGVAGGLNTFEYVGGNPVNWVDPLGLWTWGDNGNFPTVSNQDWANGTPHHDLNYPNASVPPIPTGQSFDYERYINDLRKMQRQQLENQRSTARTACLENVFVSNFATSGMTAFTEGFLEGYGAITAARALNVYGIISSGRMIESTAACFYMSCYRP